MQNQRADTSLHFAAASGHRSLVKELIEIYQLDPNAVNKVSMSKGALTNCMDRVWYNDILLYQDLFSVLS